MPHTILIADDHGIVRSGIKALVKQHLEEYSVYEAANEKEITKHVKSVFFDLILLDINMPGSDFVSMMEWLKNFAPGTNILVFSTYPAEIYGERCLQLGAKGFLNKTASNSEILVALKKVLAGGLYINAELQKIFSPLTSENKTANPFEKLSVRELEIAMLINKGHALPDICSLLNIQYSTANTYKRRIFEKLNVHNAVTLSHLLKTFKMEE